MTRKIIPVPCDCGGRNNKCECKGSGFVDRKCYTCSICGKWILDGTKNCCYKWDVRCPAALKRLFSVRTGYYYKVDHSIAREVLRILSAAYKVNPPVLKRMVKGTGANAMYFPREKAVALFSRNHLKSVFHEFYHHLDEMTDGKYNSNDNQGGSSSYSWIFAEKLWQKFTDKDDPINAKIYS